MKRTLMMLAALTLLASCKEESETPKEMLVHRLFQYAESGKIAYGHQDDLVYGHAWKVEDPEADSLLRSDVKDVCGHYPMVVGFDLGGIERGDSANLDGVPFDLMRRAALKHIERGGIVTFSWHPRNIYTGGDAWDTSSDKVVKSVLKGGELHVMFKEWLSRAAEFLGSLGDVAVIFRPWHENVGSWFWWGGALCTPQEYQELYRLTWVYMVKEKGLTNLLWCYSPNGNATPDEYMERYPGDEYVDILGFDTYEYIGSDGDIEEAGVRYAVELRDNLTKLNAFASDHKKLQCLSETGLEGLVDETWWTETLLPVIKDFPISYVLTWRNAHDKETHFYAPWPGFEWADDFVEFSENESIVML